MYLCAGIYEFGNAGGLIVMAPHKSESPSDVIYFSPDQGACWHKVQLPEAIAVENVRWVWCVMGWLEAGRRGQLGERGCF